MEKEELSKVIQKYIIPCKSEYRMGAYALKHLFEHLTGEYIPLIEFKSAMQMAGFPPSNHHYKIQVLSFPEVPSIYQGRGYKHLYNYGKLQK